MVVHKSQLFFPPSLQDLYNEQQKQQIIDSIEIDHDTKDPSKKRKMSCMCLTNLQHEHLISVANYLPKTQRALFASALTAPSSSWRSSGWKGKPNAASKAIITSANPDGRGFRWEVLDFDYNNIDESLAAKLTDDDIGALLVCIDAKNTLEMMNMRKLPQVVGYGLEPLMGSKVLGDSMSAECIILRFPRRQLFLFLIVLSVQMETICMFSSHRIGGHLVVAETYLHNIYPVFIQQ